MPTVKHSPTKHTLLLLSSVLLAYVWIVTPLLSTYSLQAFAAASIGYFIVKKINNAELWHIFPKSYSLEMMFMTFAVLLLIGSTTNLDSIFYPFTYIHLFILVMSFEEKTAIIVSMAIILFHYAIQPFITSVELATMITLPMMLLFFLFAKRQYDDAILSHSIIEKEEAEIKNLSEQEHTLESFIATFLKPKLEVLQQEKSEEIAKNQISLIISESDKILKKVAR